MQIAQHSTAQHSTAQHSAAQRSTAQGSTARHSTAQHSTAWHGTVMLAIQPELANAREGQIVHSNLTEPCIVHLSSSAVF